MAQKEKMKDVFNRERDRLRKKDESVIKINGHEVKVSDYYKDPQHYNALPLDPKYAQECLDHLEKSLRTKERLYVDPSIVKNIL
jgi:hypothetical protein